MISVKRTILLAGVIAGMIYTVFQLARPTEIVAVHINKFGNTFDHHVLVRHFPITEQGQIAWWQNHQSMLKEKYGIPKPDADGSFTVTVWEFGDGYQIEKPKQAFLDFPSHSTDHLYCFDDMPVKENCIEKKELMSITKNGRSNTTFLYTRHFFSDRSTRHRQKTEGGEIP